MRLLAFLTFGVATLGCAGANHSTMSSTGRAMRPDELSYAATDPPTASAEAFYEYRDPGIVVVALGADAVDDDDSQTSTQTLGSGVATQGAIEVQMQLVTKAAEHGPVVVLVPDNDSEHHLQAHCSRFAGLCDAIGRNVVRFVMVRHEGPWIRDFGPMLGWDTHGKAIVLDSRYYDIRKRQSEDYDRHRINQQRLSVVLKLQEARSAQGTSDDDSEDDADSDSDAKGSLLGKQFKLESFYDLLTKLNDVLKDDADFYRDLDDLAPYQIAEALFTPDSFNLYRPPLFLDGGNLIEMEGGRCLTTTDLISANGGRDDIVRRALADYFGCHQIVFLEPLPGPVIKHVDMFLMPVSRDHVLMASFLPGEFNPDDDAERAAYLESLEAAGQDLVVKAAIAMSDNERKLVDAGIKVTRVPGLLPRVTDDGVYYPTNLNALIHVSVDGTRQVFVPIYAGYAPRQQEQALRIMSNAFGPNTEIVRIEATGAAKLQGAVHCLSMLVPAKLTYILDSRHERLRTSIAGLLTLQQQKLTEGQELELQGTWIVKRAKDIPLGLKFQFRDNDLSIIGGDKSILAHYLYDDVRVRQRTWTVNLRTSETDKSPEAVSIEWLSPRTVRFVRGKDKDTIELYRESR